MTRFVICGEALIDLVRDQAVAADSFCSTWEALSAGGPMNSAVALAKLGADSHFLGRLSDDFFGRQLRHHLEVAGVSLDIIVMTEQPTTIAVVSLDEQGKASFAFHAEGTANFNWQPDELPALAAGDWLHLGTCAAVVQPGAEVLMEWAAAQTQASLSFDINVRPALIPDPADYWQVIQQWLTIIGRTAGIVKASDEDIDFLARGSGDSGSATEIATRWTRRFGLRMILVTRGGDGVSAMLEDGTDVTYPGYRTTVVDTVGAGDTFMAGFLDQYVRDPADLAAALRRGNAAAAIVVSRQGAQPPTYDELDSFLADHG